MAERELAEKVDSLRTQGGAVVSDVRTAVLHATRHLESLAELLQLELHEYGRAQVRRLALLAVGGILLLCAYALLCLLLVIWLEAYLGEIWAVVVVMAFNLLAGSAAIMWAVMRKPQGIAPATCQELNDDLQCIKLYLKGNEPS